MISSSGKDINTDLFAIDRLIILYNQQSDNADTPTSCHGDDDDLQSNGIEDDGHGIDVLDGHIHTRCFPFDVEFFTFDVQFVWIMFYNRIIST